MSHHENPGAAGTAAGAGGTQSEPDAYAHDSKNAQLTKARTLAQSGVPVLPCKPESFGDKPKRSFIEHGSTDATTNSAHRFGEAAPYQLVGAGRVDAVQKGTRTAVLAVRAERQLASLSRAHSDGSSASQMAQQ